jgi:transcriptional regulator NrdR family protein
MGALKRGGLDCVVCAFTTRVLETRQTHEGTVWRRRECLNPACRARFATEEIVRQRLPRSKQVKWLTEVGREG